MRSRAPARPEERRAPLGPEARASGDRALLVRLRAGDEEALRELVRAHGGRLLASARRLLPDEAEALEALREAFAAAADPSHGEDDPPDPGTWLVRRAVEACARRLAARAPAGAETPDGSPEFVGVGVFASPQRPWAALPEDPLGKDALAGHAEAAIRALPEPLRTALVLCDLEGLGEAELARALRLSPSLARARVHRARQALRGLLAPRFCR